MALAACGRIFGLAVVTTALGCASRPGELFPTVENAPTWPSPPDTPRVRYVGQLSTSSDLRAARNAGQSLGDALFGKRADLGLLSPYAVCTDATGQTVFVADSNGQAVHVIDLARRRWSRLAAPAPAKRFGQPVGVAFDPEGPGRLFVAASADGCLYAFDNPTDRKPTVTRLGQQFVQRPCGLAFDATRHRLFVADAAAHQVLVLSPDGRLIERLGTRGAGPGEFNFPTNVAVDTSGRLYVSDSLNFRVQQFDADLRFVRAIGRKGDMPGYFAQPKGLATDADDHLYVVDANFEAVQVFDAEGQLLLSFGEEGRGPGEFWLPAGIGIDRPRNRIWVADGYNRRVQVFDYLPAPPESPERPAETPSSPTAEVPR